MGPELRCASKQIVLISDMLISAVHCAIVFTSSALCDQNEWRWIKYKNRCGPPKPTGNGNRSWM